MGFDLAFATCFEVDQDLIEAALAPAQSLTDPAPRDKIFALIERMGRIARPRQGAARLLMVFARLAECGWLEGDLEILLCDLGEATGIDVMLHDGLSFVRLHAPIRVGVPFEEFTTAFERDPLAVSPLEQAPADLDVLRLRATEATRSRGARNAADFPVPKADLPDLLAEPPESEGEFETKPTVKMAAVRIPREAYRDGHPPPDSRRPTPPVGKLLAAGGPVQRRRGADARDAGAEPPAEPITRQMAAARRETAGARAPSQAEESPATKRAVDDIDEGWE